MDNVLVTFASWEERSVLGFQRDIVQCQNLSKIFILKCENTPYPSETDNNISKIKCSSDKMVCEDFNVPMSETERWHSLDRFVQNIAVDTNLYIDITTMPRNIIWTLFFFCKQKIKQISILYHTPENYSTEWLTKDPDMPQLLFKHSGIIEFGKPTTLFILSGFDEDRVVQLVNYYEPQNVVIGECNPRKKCNYGIVDETFSVDQYDNTWGYNTIESKIISILETSNLIVASLGPKTGAISVYRCFMKYPQMALAYVPCKEFNVDYSKGIRETLIKKIVFE